MLNSQTIIPNNTKLSSNVVAKYPATKAQLGGNRGSRTSRFPMVDGSDFKGTENAAANGLVTPIVCIQFPTDPGRRPGSALSRCAACDYNDRRTLLLNGRFGSFSDCRNSII